MNNPLYKIIYPSVSSLLSVQFLQIKNQRLNSNVSQWRQIKKCNKLYQTKSHQRFTLTSKFFVVWSYQNPSSREMKWSRKGRKGSLNQKKSIDHCSETVNLNFAVFSMRGRPKIGIFKTFRWRMNSWNSR